MSCSHVKSYVNLLSWLLVGCSLLCSSGANLLVDTTLDNDYNTLKFPSLFVDGQSSGQPVLQLALLRFQFGAAGTCLLPLLLELAHLNNGG